MTDELDPVSQIKARVHLLGRIGLAPGTGYDCAQLFNVSRTTIVKELFGQQRQRAHGRPAGHHDHPGIFGARIGGQVQHAVEAVR